MSSCSHRSRSTRSASGEKCARSMPRRSTPAASPRAPFPCEGTNVGAVSGAWWAPASRRSSIHSMPRSRPETAQDQGDAIAPAELVELAQAERRRGIEALHHAEVEEEVAHAGLDDQIAAGLHKPAREGEEEIALQAERAAEASMLLEDSGVL